MSTPTIDHRAVFLQQRAVRHELLSRSAASYFCNRASPCVVHLCRLRKCHRDRVCSGPMRTSAVLLDRLNELHRLGLPSSACTVLPARLAAADQALLQVFEQWREWWTPRLKNLPEMTWPQLSKVLRYSMRRDCDEGDLSEDGENDL